ncbi:hypothetical protein PG993_005340 [Apiospora rasikravindrae]|uniref:Ecp2 effector protein-like domain-containing protein n=1 Tax=Apiospora rasikravindrae TaxID=990691 RepID=A0ABR1TFA3_9PEZI
MKIMNTRSIIATTLLLPSSHGLPEKIQARADETHDTKNQIPIAKEWLDNASRQVPQWRPEPPIPSTKRLTLCKTTSPAVADLDPAKDAGGSPLPSRDSCDLLARTLGSDWLYFSKWTLAGAESSLPKQQPWILAETNKCVFVVTGWHSPKDNGGKKLTIEVGNDDVQNLVRESLDHHVKIADEDFPRVGTKGSMDCGGILVEWRLRKMECPMGKHSAAPTWCTKE